nr:type I polyketide synthase [Mycolicibacter kumamotonensis]
MNEEYGPRVYQDREGYAGNLMTGDTCSVASGRVAYVLGLTGPAVSVDTACSSSLVAVHMGVRALRSGDCSLVLAGGVAAMTLPNWFVGFSALRVLAKDGRCKAFSDDADGFGLSEGVGVLVLERLADARRNGHRVLALVRGSAVNQDGASDGLRAPNPIAQQQVIRTALLDAGIDSNGVDAVEAHGTGTTLGDAVEAEALLAAYGEERDSDPLWVGSVKSNIGHTLAAGGSAGLIKMIEAIRRGVLPATLHADVPTSRVDWSTGAVRLLHEGRPWPEKGRPRRAAVSSFGISGTNAHVILEQAPPGEPAVLVWPLSARNPKALAAQAMRLHDFAERRAGVPPAAIAGALARRTVFEHRAVIVGADRDALMSRLSVLAEGESCPGLVAGQASATGKTAFVFPGQGSQWIGMGRELLSTSAVFAEHMTTCGTVLAEFVDWDLLAVIREEPGSPALGAADVVQPVLFAVFVALAQTWRSLGVTPDAVIGHSQGEVAAAHVAGALSLREAARIVVLRSRAVAVLSGAGGMVSVPLPKDEVSEHLDRWGGKLEVAAVNSPRTTVVSGACAAIDKLLVDYEAAGVEARRIPVDYAAHSAQIEAVEDDLRAALGQVTPEADTATEFYSTVYGKLIGSQVLDGDYWCRNLREPVRFDEAVQAAYGEGVHCFLEMSPHPVLTVSVEQNCEVLAEDGGWFVGGSLRRDDGGLARLLESAAEAYAAGVAIDWSRYVGCAGAEVELPPYPFTRTRFWLDASESSRLDVSRLGVGECDHPILAAVLEQPASGEVTFTGRVSLRSHPWLADHAVGGVVLMPGAALVDCALFAGDQVGHGVVQELVLQAPLIVPEQHGVHLQVIVGREVAAGRPLSVYSRVEGVDDGWSLNAQGTLVRATSPVPQPVGTWPPAGAEPVDVSDTYQRAAERGYNYGPVFRGVVALWTGDDEVFADIALPEQARDQVRGYVLHPALLDAALHGFSHLGIAAEPGKVLLPFVWEQVNVSAIGASRLRVRLKAVGDNRVAVLLYDHLGEPVATVGALSMRDTWRDALHSRRSSISDDALFSIGWVPGDVDAAPGADWVDITGARAGEGPIQVLRCVDGGVADGASVRGRLWSIAEHVRDWMANCTAVDARLVVVTSGAVAVDGSDAAPDLTHAGVWGLVRTVQAEEPGRLVLLDVDDWAAVPEAVAAVLASGEPESAYRRGSLRVPRLTRFDRDGVLKLEPGTAAWSVGPAGLGALGADNFVVQPASLGALGPTEVRVEVSAVGVNFRDVLVTLGMYPDPDAVIGCEGAGVVTAVGAEVTGFAPGDRVFGVLPGIASTTDVDHRLLAAVPGHCSFAEAATIPVVFLTAYYALHDLVDVRPGQRILIHAATGGLGMAVHTLAKAWGLEVFATASPSKWPVLRGLGLDQDHIASSRDLDFERRFRDATGGEGVDIVINSLANEYTDASLRLLSRGGTFVEMGLTDLRDPDDIATGHPGVVYLPVVVWDAGPQRIGEMLREVMALLAVGSISAPPVSVWDVRRLPEVYRYLSQARHIGKIALRVPRPLDGDGTVLVTGGTSGLGALIARHLAAHHGIRHLLLVSRSGGRAEGAAALVAELAELGAQARVAACDASDRAALAAVLADVPAEHPLTGVVHAAELLRDGVFADLTAEQFDAVLRSKVDSAWNLHELTAHDDLAAFVLFSSAAGVLGSPGQSNYGAANAYLDALAQYRQHRGLPATSLAWGLWEQKTGMTGHLNEQDRARMNRIGLAPITTDDGLELFDDAMRSGHTSLVPARLSLDEVAAAGRVPHLLRLLTRAARRQVADDDDVEGQSNLAALLGGAPAEDRERIALDFVRVQAAAVLGHDGTNTIPSGESFRSLGVDSLTGVEFRNRLQTATGLKLTATIVFDQPTPYALSKYLLERMAAPESAG